MNIYQSTTSYSNQKHSYLYEWQTNASEIKRWSEVDAQTLRNTNKSPRQTFACVPEMTAGHFRPIKHAWQTGRGWRKSRKWHHHAGIPQQCLGWMKRREAAPGATRRGKEKHKSIEEPAKKQNKTAAATPAGLEEWTLQAKSSWETAETAQISAICTVTLSAIGFDSLLIFNLMFTLG